MNQHKTQSSRFFVLSFIFMFFVLHSVVNSFAEDKIIAIVNNDIITQKELNDFFNFMYVQLSMKYEKEQLEEKIQSMKLDLLDRLIEDHLILQEAKKNNLKIDENRVKAKVDEIKKHYASDMEFQNALSQQGLTQSNIESKIREQLLMYMLIDIKIRNKLVINPTEVTDFYQKNMDRFKLPEQREVISITINDENIANEIFNNLKDTGDLNNLSDRYSLQVDRIIASRNGELRKEVEDAVFELRLGQISHPIKINDTFYILKLDRIILPRQQNLYEVQDKIYTFLFDSKMQRDMARWLDELKKNSYIKILQD